MRQVPGPGALGSPEESGGEGGGRGDRDGEYMADRDGEYMGDSCQCMTKPTAML